MDKNPKLPFDVNDPEVQRACRAVARWLMGDAGIKESRRTALAVMIAATGDSQAPRDTSDDDTRIDAPTR